MNKLSKDKIQMIKQLAGLTQDQLKKLMFQMLRSKYKRVVCTKDYVYAVGDIPVVLLAHMDTVFTAPPTHIYYDQEKTTMWSPEGLGADDRAGVYAICQILQDGYRPSIVFTTNEEIGCIGASKLANRKCPFKNAKYAIQLDRRGVLDCVFYECDNREFVDYVEKFGFEEEIGSFTDIAVLCPTWGIAGVNLSVGYFNEHHEIETLNTNYLAATIQKVENMLQDANNAPKFEYIELENYWSKYKNYCYGDDYGYGCYNYGLDYEDDYDVYGAPTTVCGHCGATTYAEDTIPLYNCNTDVRYPICLDCLSSLRDIQFCEECGEAFIPLASQPDASLCTRCQKDKKEEKKIKKHSKKEAAKLL